MNTTPTTPTPSEEEARQDATPAAAAGTDPSGDPRPSAARRGRMLPAAIAGGVVALLLAFGAGVATGALIEGPGFGWRGGPAFDGTPGGPDDHERGHGG